MFHGNVKGRSYGNERVEISRESDYCLEFDAIRCLAVALPATLKNVTRIVYFRHSVRRNFSVAAC